MAKRKSKSPTAEILDSPEFDESVSRYIEEFICFNKEKAIGDLTKAYKDIPVRIKTLPQQAPMTVDKKGGQTVCVMYPPGLEQEVSAHEQSLRDRAIQYLVSQCSVALDVADWNDQALPALMHDIDKLLYELDFLTGTSPAPGSGPWMSPSRCPSAPGYCF